MAANQNPGIPLVATCSPMKRKRKNYVFVYIALGGKGKKIEIGHLYACYLGSKSYMLGSFRLICPSRTSTIIILYVKY